MKPTDYPKHPRDPQQKRFHVRTYNGGLFQVYAVGLEHICECTDGDKADMIADALEESAELTRLRTIASEYEELRAAVVEMLNADAELAGIQLKMHTPEEAPVSEHLKATGRVIEATDKLRSMTKGGE